MIQSNARISPLTVNLGLRVSNISYYVGPTCWISAPLKDLYKVIRPLLAISVHSTLHTFLMNTRTEKEKNDAPPCNLNLLQQIAQVAEPPPFGSPNSKICNPTYNKLPPSHTTTQSASNSGWNKEIKCKCNSRNWPKNND